MDENQIKTITLMVNRHERIVRLDTIIYAQVREKLCTIYLTDAEPLKLFLSMTALRNMLLPPPKDLYRSAEAVSCP